MKLCFLDNLGLNSFSNVYTKYNTSTFFENQINASFIGRVLEYLQKLDAGRIKTDIIDGSGSISGMLTVPSLKHANGFVRREFEVLKKLNMDKSEVICEIRFKLTHDELRCISFAYPFELSTYTDDVVQGTYTFTKPLLTTDDSKTESDSETKKYIGLAKEIPKSVLMENLKELKKDVS